MEFTLLWAVLTGFAAAFVTLRLTKPSQSKAKLPDRPFDRLIGAAMAGLAAGRVAALISQGTNPITSPGELLIVRGGVDTVWAAVVAGAFLCWPLRRNMGALDALGPAVLAGLAGWHGGCLWRSTCLGTVSDLPWTWSLPGSGLTRHPVEIYTALLLLAGAWTVSWIRRPAGAGVAMTISWAALARLLTEPFRPALGDRLWWFYGVAIVFGLSLAGALAFRNVAKPLEGSDKAAGTPYPPQL
jgi:prolipoprotein diacylglyceryltransferase